MNTMPSKELLAKWRTEYAADLDASLAEIKRQALEDFDRKWSRDMRDGSESSRITPTTEEKSVKPSRETVATRNGSSNGTSGVPTAKQMMLRVLPEPGEDFTSSYIKAEILKKWPNANGKHLSSRISKALKEWLDDGKLEKVGRGDRIQDPIIYRVKESDGGTLLEP